MPWYQWEFGSWHRLSQTPLPEVTTPFYGAAVGGNSSPSVLEIPAGRSIGVRRTYWNAGQEDACISLMTQDIAAKRVPWVSFKLPVSWASAITGGADTWAQALCARIGALPGPVMLTWHHEPEGDQSPLADFVDMHDRLYLFTKPYANIKCGPLLTGYDYFIGSDPERKLPNLWPGTFDSGDFLGFDDYNYYGTGSPTITTYRELGATYFTPLAAFAKSKGVPWAIGEYGLSHAAADYDITRSGDILGLRKAWATAVSLGGCLALAYFDSNLNSVTDWRLETHSNPSGITKLSVFTDILQNSPPWRPSW